ncbi:hypothetical protein MY1884_000628 [Beauveria asiatica]
MQPRSGETRASEPMQGTTLKCQASVCTKLMLDPCNIKGKANLDFCSSFVLRDILVFVFLANVIGGPRK